MSGYKYKINAWIIKAYNSFMKTRLININHPVMRRVRAMFYHNICYGCHACFGSKNPTRKFYVIRCPQSTLGFFGLYNFVIYHIKIAEKMGYEPIVDWKYYPNSSVIGEKAFAKTNAWEYYFEPMMDLSIDEVYESQNVWMGSGEFNGSLGEAHDARELLKSNKIVEKYMRPNKNVRKRFMERYKEYHMDSEKILGVLCRGTDFIASKPKYHTICPTGEQMIDIIEKKMNEWSYYEHIFVATEDKKILKVLKDYYGERLLVNQTAMLDYSGNKWLNEWYNQMDVENCIEITMQYFISILLLSNCDALIAPLVGGTLGAMRMKGKFERCYITELGCY